MVSCHHISPSPPVRVFGVVGVDIRPWVFGVDIRPWIFGVVGVDIRPWIFGVVGVDIRPWAGHRLEGCSGSSNALIARPRLRNGRG